MVLILFHVQRLRGFVVDGIRATDRVWDGEPRLPEGTKQPDQKAFQILVEDGVITKEECEELRSLIDYRNVVAHATEKLTLDVHREAGSLPSILEKFSRYEAGALEKLEALRDKIYSGMMQGFVLPISFDAVWFEPAEKAYKEELRRLRAKIRRQYSAHKAEIESVNANIKSLPDGLIEELEPGHPEHWTNSGTLSDSGVRCCYSLFGSGATPLAVAHLMRMSLRSAKNRHSRWNEEVQGGSDASHDAIRPESRTE